MDYFDKVANLDIPYIVIGIVVIILLVKFLFETIEWLCAKFGIEFKRVREQREREQLLNKNVQQIQELETKSDNNAEALRVVQETLNVLTENITDIKNSVSELKDSDIAQRHAMIETMHDRIEQKSNYYINTLKGIPSNELDSYTRLFDGYRAIGGNHALELLVDYCLHNLPILPPSNPVRRN